ncbi:uncharacterized protein LOC117170183 [Belonocnema kinseyi]|uniref:uncharacterized protein LOC117170183 n=1 Tax=Belonocnema kinseyi TaxID=2817044 RepID=UPI00143D30B7|nr:uncharacterized protein LOC117170183 [Belonocnema kinseyi]
MKFLITSSVIFIICYVVTSSTLSLVEPISFALQRNINMSLAELQSKCNNSYTELENLKRETFSFGNNLQHSINEKLPNPKSNDGLESLLDNDCTNNSDLKNVSRRVVQIVQTCLDDKLKLDTAKEDETKKAIINALCGGIRISIEWQIHLRKILQNQ